MLLKRLIKLLIVVAILCIAILPVDGALAQEEMTTVHVDGLASGFLPAPCDCPADVFVVVNAHGSEDSLAGSGINLASTGSKNRFSVTGSVEDAVVSLSGTVYSSNVPYLVGSHIEISANEETGALQFTIVPSGGPFAGQSLVFVGSGNVVITDD